MSTMKLLQITPLVLACAGALLLTSSEASAATFKPSDLGGPFDASDDATLDTVERFGLKHTGTGVDDAAAFLYLEDAGFAPQNSFGIYAAGSPGTTLEVFSGAATPSFFGKTIRWDDTTGDVCIWSGASCVGAPVNGIDKNNFGFYMKSPQGLFTSETALNGDGFDHMVSYFVNGTAGVDYVLGWEDLTGGGDKDYNDMVVGIHDVVPSNVPSEVVPIPGAVWLLGSALAGLVTVARRQGSVAC